MCDLNGLEQVQREKEAEPSQNEIFSYQRQPVWHAQLTHCRTAQMLVMCILELQLIIWKMPILVLIHFYSKGGSVHFLRTLNMICLLVSFLDN